MDETEMISFKLTDIEKWFHILESSSQIGIKTVSVKCAYSLNCYSIPDIVVLSAGHKRAR